ncbi:MAG: nuclear transport factor 2 family protein [Actinomycetota bacterium]|nr:nuclear transport factor 2 family protein [Actinomycetota bacterium]
MALPDDPAAFVAAAERGINDYDLDATAAVYAGDALLENYVDGTFESWEGADAVRRAWGMYLEAMKERRFTLRKTLVSAADDTIVNTWTGSLGGRTDAEGIEYWRFDGDGKVRQHRLYSLMNVKPSTNPLGRARMAFAYPLSALAFLRARKRAGV